MSVNPKIQEKLYECDKHIEKIIIAKNHLKHIMPLSVKGYEQLNDIQISFIDQLNFRFSKLQDTLGEKIMPAILIISKEDVKRKTFIDILNRLEELEIIDKQNWLNLREIRNSIAHEYSFNAPEVVNSIADIYNNSDDLMQIYQTIKKFIISRL